MIFADVDEDDCITMYNLDELVSREAHPNFHAVNFLTQIAVIVLKDGRCPSDIELDDAFKQSVRGKATVDTPIGWPGLKESFTVIVEDCIRTGNRGFMKDTVTSLAREVSTRLDEVISLQHT